MIDGKRKLNSKTLAQLRDSLSDSELLSIFNLTQDKEVMYLNKDLIKFFTTEIDTTINKNDVLLISSSTETLEILGYDYLYWIKRQEKLDSLFKGTKVTKTKTTTESTAKNNKSKINEYNVEIAIFDDTSTELLHQLAFTGSKKEAIEFINSNYAIYQLKTFFKSTIVFKINNSDWMMFEDLINNGLVVLK